MAERYLKQVIVVRKDLSMPTGKLAAMVAHASMSFIVNRIEPLRITRNSFQVSATFTPVQYRWLYELDPGLEDIGQRSFAKIVCSVNDLDELLDIEQRAATAGIESHRVVDSGHSHNKRGDIACIAIGPEWPETLEPVTGHLKVYR